MIQGYDFSQYQGDIPQSVFDTLKSQGWFSFIRVNEGTPNNPQVLNIDAQFKANQDKSRTADNLRGYYHFSYPTLNSASSESQFFVSQLSDIQEGEVLALDFETPFKDAQGNPTQENVVWAKLWLDTVASSFNGTKPVIYMNLSLENSIDWTPVAQAGYALWLAEWTGNPNDLKLGADWSFIAFSQFSDQAIVPGISGRVDQDAFYGNAQQFLDYGYHAPVVSPAPVSVTQTITTNPSTDADAEEITNLEGQIKSLTSEVHALNASLMATQSEYADDEATISQLTSKVDNLTASNTSLAQRNAELVTKYGAITKSTPVVAPVVNTGVWSKIVAFFKGL